MNNTVWLVEQYLKSLNTALTRNLTEEYLRYEWEDEDTKYTLNVYEDCLEWYFIPHVIPVKTTDTHARISDSYKIFRKSLKVHKEMVEQRKKAVREGREKEEARRNN